MKTRTARAACAAFLAVGALGPAEAALLDRVGVYADYWAQDLDGQGRMDGASRGSDFSLEGDVGLRGDEGIVEIGAWFHPFGRHRLRLSGFRTSFEGGGTLPRDLLVGNRLLPQGEVVISDFDLALYRAHYGYSVVNSDLLNFALVAGVDYVDSDGTITFTGGKEAASVRTPIPVVGLSLQVSPPVLKFLRVYGEASASNVRVGDLDAEVRDVAARAEFYVVHVLGIGAGYRKLRLDASEEGTGRIDLDSEGYQLYFLLRF
jgi:hypothetical protein